MVVVVVAWFSWLVMVLYWAYANLEDARARPADVEPSVSLDFFKTGGQPVRAEQGY